MKCDPMCAMVFIMRTYTVTEAAKMLNRSVKTLQRLDRQKKLVATRTPTNRRIYSHEQLLRFTGLYSQGESVRKTIVYSRVSSCSQKNDLANQRKVLEIFCAGKAFDNVEYVDDIGGGLNFKRPKLLKILEQICSGEVERLVIAHKDRLCRFGFSLVEWLLSKNSCEIVVLNQEHLSPEEEMVQDLMTIINCFSSRLYGLRNYKKGLKKALENGSES